MAFEELPPEYAEFFNNGGELPTALAAEQAAAAAAVPAPSPAPTATPVAVESTPAATPAPATIPDAPVAPTTNPYLERLLAEKDSQVTQLADQIKALQDRITKATEPAAPDPLVDPLGHLNHQLKTMQANLDKLITSQTEATTQTTQDRQA